MTSYCNSLLTTTFVALDRYIAVRFSLRYQLILTKKETLLALAVGWFLSFTISGINWINISIYFQVTRRFFVTFTVIRIIISVVLLTLSRCTNVIRKRHTRNIERRNEYFGVAKEKIDLLRALKNTLEDSFKLYIWTVLLTMVLIRIVDMVRSDTNSAVHWIFVLLLYMTDVIILPLTQRDIQKALYFWSVVTMKFNLFEISVTSVNKGCIINFQNK